MAQLDPLLGAMLEKQATELVMTEGRPAAFRMGDALRPVSQKSLDRGQISRLLSELSDQIDLAQLAGGAPARFVYRMANGQHFACEVSEQQGSLNARLVPQPAGTAAPEATEPAAAPPPQAAAAPSTAPPSVSMDGRPEIERLLVQMVQEGASDLHLTSGEMPRFRLHGDMVPVGGAQPISAQKMIELIEPITPQINIDEFAETNDTDYAHEIPGLARFRVNVFTDRNGRGAVFRMIPSEILTAEQLGLPPAILEMCKLSKGLVVVTGPTGSGKSTTLAAMIDHINKSRNDHIITIEDPIEFVHPQHQCLINQREINTHTCGFKPALRAALREDPDIVLVGEMRDLETIAIAIETAETGHLVFGTLHTTTAISTVDRIIDQFPADRQAQIRVMLSESLKGVVAQTLLKKNGGGRVAALEILVVTPAISNLIREGKTFQMASLMQTGRKLGMVLLNDALLDLVKSKTVDPGEAYRKAVDKAGLAAAFRSAKITFDDSADS